RHREEVDEPRAFIAAKQGSKLSQLYGLPESQTGGNDDNPRQQKAGVDQLLHGIVAAKITMAEPTSDRRTKIAHDLGREYRQELLPEVPSHQPNRHIHRTIDEKQPHGREMPEQPAGEPATKGDRLRKGKAKQRRGVVNLPTRSDHDQCGQCIDPMGYPHIERMDFMVRQARGGSPISGHPMVPVCAIAAPEYTSWRPVDAFSD